MVKDVKLIKVSLEIREWLKTLGRKGESYDQILRRLREEAGKR